MSDGQFSSKPLRSERSRDVANAYSTEPILSADVTQAFLQSPTVRRKVGALLNLPFPEIGPSDCALLDACTPKAALNLGEPMASATLAQEYLIGLVFLRVAGWVFIACGVMFVVSALGLGVTVIFNQGNPQNVDQLGGEIVVAAIGLAIGVVGVVRHPAGSRRYRTLLVLPERHDLDDRRLLRLVQMGGRSRPVLRPGSRTPRNRHQPGPKRELDLVQQHPRVAPPGREYRKTGLCCVSADGVAANRGRPDVSLRPLAFVVHAPRF